MKCKICGRRASGGPCRWIVQEFVRTTYGEIQEGDVVRRASKGTDHRPPARIHALVTTPSAPDWIHVTLAIPHGKRVRFKQIVVMKESPVRVLQATYCNADTCERHHIELSHKKHICADHWRPFREQIAS